MRVILKLTVDIHEEYIDNWYDGDMDAATADAEDAMDSLVRNAADRGEMTGAYDGLIVEQYHHEVEIIEGDCLLDDMLGPGPSEG